MLVYKLHEQREQILCELYLLYIQRHNDDNHLPYIEKVSQLLQLRVKTIFISCNKRPGLQVLQQKGLNVLLKASRYHYKLDAIHFRFWIDMI